MSRDYKPTLQLPDSDFPMKADLARREPDWLARWKADGLYASMLAQNSAKRFVFHDGPPYANGHMHYGHVLNNSLKDFVTRYRNIAGEKTLFVPGWDCHGLPIELNVDKALGAKKREMSVAQVREVCRKEASKWVDVQREERMRLGVLGTWDHPYLTMSPEYEGSIVRALAAFVERGLVYRGKKPVQWCSNDRTALAEAEVEYIEKHVSPSVYVKFPASEATQRQLASQYGPPDDRKYYAIIWTTTPWTLPANLMIAVHPSEEYVFVEIDGSHERWLIARKRVDDVLKATNRTGSIVEHPRTVGQDLAVLPGGGGSGLPARLVFTHPWEKRASKLVCAQYVDMESGTGLVHTAPGHGRDDYVTGLSQGVEPYAPLDDAGRFTDELDDGSKALGLVGKSVWEANPIIVQMMAERGILANAPNDKITHKYPGCWRCHKPLITRATTQWFIALDEAMKGDAQGKSLRARALEEIDRLAAAGEGAAKAGDDSRGWVPAWGRERIYGMIANRPDWCISRQRVWGVPIPALHCEKCQHATLNVALLEHVAKVFDKLGAGAWYDDNAPVVPPDFKCEECGSTGPFGRDQSIVDVWFESGSSFYAVCDGKPDLGFPVDLYLEGSDQHRGWFHSALLVGIAMKNRAPFETVVTAGFVVDEKGEALSKSTINERKAKGEDVSHFDPMLMIKQQGAELLRAWTAYEDYQNDIRLSKEHFGQVADAYRKLRNAFRFMLQVMRKQPAPALDTVELRAVDRWALARLADVVNAAHRAYRTYEFRSVFMGGVEFLGDLSATYLDAIKDWMYNDEPDSPRRRSTLAVIDTIVRSMATVLAPILPFTAEDVWDHLPKRPGDPKSVHLTHWPAIVRPRDADALFDAARVVASVRETVHAELEPLVQAWGVERQAAKKEGREPGTGARAFPEALRIDHPRDAMANIGLDEGSLRALEPLRESLAELLVLGHAEVAPSSKLEVSVKRATTAACDRCWRRRPDVSAAGLCARCAEAVRIYDERHKGSA